MRNQSILNEFFLYGFSDLPALQLPLFLIFLLIYLLTLILNLLTIVLIVTDSRLHVPMYFFVGNLAVLDLCYSSGNRSKVFSTCNSHLTLLFVNYGSSMFNYFWQSAGHHFYGDKGVAIFYTVILPFLNPLIYSLRNQDFRTAFQRVFRRIFPPK
ncbi:hypothetical protein AB205_0005610 [Aquarana catesbeiana]|uniref:G-protein coupled receptors family 1 profile domain-containing protein n=1 Tax=Aquarana catesbeiana TaxID=8400 RepID=A0A2G9Q1A8_AQUCT|nr:hypothetical protein AB205_0005610 [Aquarana catesbeiana]